jgi:hypothetical protein
MSLALLCENFVKFADDTRYKTMLEVTLPFFVRGW